MDKRIKNRSMDENRQLVEEFYQKFSDSQISIQDATKLMRKISGLTQPEFANNRRVSLPTLRKIETDAGSTTVDTLNKIGEIFGLEIGFVKKTRKNTILK